MKFDEFDDVIAHIVASRTKVSSSIRFSQRPTYVRCLHSEPGEVIYEGSIEKIASRLLDLREVSGGCDFLVYSFDDLTGEQPSCPREWAKRAIKKAKDPKNEIYVQATISPTTKIPTDINLNVVPESIFCDFYFDVYGYLREWGNDLTPDLNIKIWRKESLKNEADQLGVSNSLKQLIEQGKI